LTEDRDLESLNELIVRPWGYRGLTVKEAKGCLLIDLDGRSYIDTTSSYFVQNIGHCPQYTQIAFVQNMLFFSLTSVQR